MKYPCHGCARNFGEDWVAPLWVLEPGGAAQRNLCLHCVRDHRPALMDPLEGSQWIMELTLQALAAPDVRATPGELAIHAKTAEAMRDPDIRGAFLELVAGVTREMDAGAAGAEAG